MKRIRISTLMMLVAIIALGVAYLIQGRRAALRESELRDRLRSMELGIKVMEFEIKVARMTERAREQSAAAESAEEEYKRLRSRAAEQPTGKFFFAD